MQTCLLPTTTPAEFERAVAAAVETLLKGEIVALPTETVYGLAGNALNPAAAARIFEAKERPFFDPLICHLPDREWLGRMAAIPGESRRLVEQLATRFWPGPLTLVLPRRPIVPDLVTSGLETVALRMSAHPVFAAVGQRLGRPLAAPSANRFGRISPTAATHVNSELAGRIGLILDGGPTLHGVESTIVAVEKERLQILRSGPITAEELGNYGLVGVALPGAGDQRPRAPGQLASHYAPRTPLRLVAHREEGSWPARTAILAWREKPAGVHAEVLSPSGDLREAAATLFAKMRRLDEGGYDLIVAEGVPEQGLGVAIMDRLRRAAAPGS